MDKWRTNSRTVLSSPKSFFASLDDQDSGYLQHGLISLSLLSIFSGLFYAGYMLITALGQEVPAVFGSPTGTLILSVFGAFISWLVMAPLIILTALAVFGSAAHLIAKVLGGKTYRETVRPVSYSATVFAFIGWIPFLNLLAMIYWLYPLFIGLKKQHEIGSLKALIVMSPFVLMTAFFLALSLDTNKVVTLISLY